MPTGLSVYWKKLTRIYVRRTLFALLVFGVISGCATSRAGIDAPRVTIAGLGLVRANLLEQHYLIQLRIQNPNPVSLDIDGMEYQIEINDQVFARGVSSRRLTVTRYSMDVVEVVAVSTLADVMRQLMALDSGAQHSLRYRVRGEVSLRNRGLRLPFDYQGEITLPADLQGSPA